MSANDDWRNYTIESDTDPYVNCRNTAQGAGCEWTWAPDVERTGYMSIGEAADAAQAHERWHAANPESVADGESPAEWYTTPLAAST